MKYLKLFQKFNEAMEIDLFGNLKMPDCITDETDDDPDIAYEKGVESYEKGYDTDECPYSDPYLKDAWISGYYKK
jgi:hypothetical protein